MITLSDYGLVIINSSAGKDSLCAIWEICRIADEQGYPKGRITISHQDLGESEWKGTSDLAKQQAELFGLNIYIMKRQDKHGNFQTLLERVESRGMWPSSTTRYCTSDFKRDVGCKLVTRLTTGAGRPDAKVLHVFGFRAQESPARKKKQMISVNKRLSNKSRTVHDYLPIHDWTTKEVWNVIKGNNLPYHQAYNLGMPRLSCVFCIFSPFDALVVAGKANPELLDKYIEVEDKIGHTFKNKESLRQVREAIQNGYEPLKVQDWTM